MSALFVQLIFEKQYFAYLWGKIRAGANGSVFI